MIAINAGLIGNIDRAGATGWVRALVRVRAYAGKMYYPQT
jgi:hypothetical protein